MDCFYLVFFDFFPYLADDYISVFIYAERDKGFFI